jgi:hypothetical protein
MIKLNENGELVKDSTQFKKKSIYCSSYDELMGLFRRDDLSVVDVYGPPPPKKFENGVWVWKKPIVPIWKVIVEPKSK